MPDTTPTHSVTKSEAPAAKGARSGAALSEPALSEPALSEAARRPDLATLRASLDGIDDKIHDLLMERARIVEHVSRSNKPAAFRPGREAAMLRRLLARHTGRLPARTLVRMWREMLAGTTAMQTQVKIAASEDTLVAAMAREHFGFLTPVLSFPTAEAALAAVRSGQATIAALPFPAEANPWWPALTQASPRLYILARLPYWASRPTHVPSADVLVVGTTAPDASGDDRSFIANADRARLADTGLIPLATHGSVAEVDTMVAEDDPRLPKGAIVLGGYARPMGQAAGDHA